MNVKVGDVVRIKLSHHADPGMIGTVIEDFAKTDHNLGKAFRVLLSNGKIKTKMAKNLEVLNENS